MVKFVPKFGVRPIIDFEVFEVATFRLQRFFCFGYHSRKEKILDYFQTKNIITYEQKFLPKRILSRVRKTIDIFSTVFVVIFIRLIFC